MPSSSIRAAVSVLLFAALALPGAADRVITSDGRVVVPRKAREQGDGYHLIFEHGEIVVADKSLVQAIEIEGDMSDYVPQNDDEREKLAMGYVRFEGRWMSKPSYEAELARRFQSSRQRLQLLADHARFEDGWRKESKHFDIQTNTSPELLDYYEQLLEGYYALMDKRVGISPTPTWRKKKMKVNIYKSREEFTRYSKMDPAVAGFFQPADGSLNFYHDYADPTISDWVSLHECTHLLTFLIDQQYVAQIWLNEAVADYFGSSTITRDKRGKIEIEPGKLQLDRTLTVQQALADDSYVRLADLFFITRDEFHAFEYAHAWSFVYFLNNYERGKYQSGFKKYFKDVYTLAKGLEFDVIVGAPPTGVGKQVKPEVLRDHLLSCIKVSDLAKLEEQWKGFIAAIPLDAPEARLKRGIRAAQMFDMAGALPDLDAAIEAGTKDGRAYWARALARRASGQNEAALADLERALELDPLNAAYRYDHSQMLMGNFSLTGGGGGMTISVEIQGQEVSPEKRAQAREAAGLAMELDPSNDRYREWFASLAE